MAKQIDINGLAEFKKKCDETYAKVGQGGGSSGTSSILHIDTDLTTQDSVTEQELEKITNALEMNAEVEDNGLILSFIEENYGIPRYAYYTNFHISESSAGFDFISTAGGQPLVIFISETGKIARQFPKVQPPKIVMEENTITLSDSDVYNLKNNSFVTFIAQGLEFTASKAIFIKDRVTFVASGVEGYYNAAFTLYGNSLKYELILEPRDIAIRNDKVVLTDFFGSDIIGEGLGLAELKNALKITSVPEPPTSGNYVLKSVDGVVQWVKE